MSFNGLEIVRLALNTDTESGRTNAARVVGNPILFCAPSTSVGRLGVRAGAWKGSRPGAPRWVYTPRTATAKLRVRARSGRISSSVALLIRFLATKAQSQSPGGGTARVVGEGPAPAPAVSRSEA